MSLRMRPTPGGRCARSSWRYLVTLVTLVSLCSGAVVAYDGNTRDPENQVRLRQRPEHRDTRVTRVTRYLQLDRAQRPPGLEAQKHTGVH